MYTALFVADLHIGWKLYNNPELEQDLKDILVRIVDIAISNKFTFLVIVGDLFDDNSPTPDIVEFVISQLYKAKTAGIKVVGIAGDHDREINKVSWGHISGIESPINYPYFVGLDYCDKPSIIMDFIRNYDKREKVEWILAHGQESCLFQYVDEKKKLTFKDFPLFELYPNIKGVVLGDIHIPIEGSLIEKDKSAFIGYCGSPGVIKSNEIDQKKGLLYWDGKKLGRLPFPLDRRFVKMDLKGDKINKVDINLYRALCEKDSKKPVFRIEYDRDSEPFLTKINELYQFGIVHTTKTKSSQYNQEEAVNIRSELSNEDRIAQVLGVELPNKVAYDLCLSIITQPDNAAALLDKLRKEMINV